MRRSRQQCAPRRGFMAPIPMVELQSDRPLPSISFFVQWAHANGVIVNHVRPKWSDVNCSTLSITSTSVAALE
jgi:hypothetical protein